VLATEGAPVATARRAAAFRAVVCDDDPLVRGIVADLVVASGGTVIGEADTAAEALLLVQRFRPDVVVLDLNLRRGTGREVLEAVAASPDAPRVVVFTAYDQMAPAGQPGIDVAYKPDFEGLARCLQTLDDRPVERRRPARRLPGSHRPVLDDAAAFYRVLTDALPGDVLVSVRCPDRDPGATAALVRRVVRAQDRVHARAGDVLALLVGAGDEGVGALQGRLRTELPDVDARLRAAEVGDDPVGAFDRLTR